MQTNLIYIRKQAIPKLLGLLGKALSEEGDNVCLKECNYSGGYTMIKLGEELVDEYKDMVKNEIRREDMLRKN